MEEYKNPMNTKIAKLNPKSKKLITDFWSCIFDNTYVDAMVLKIGEETKDKGFIWKNIDTTKHLRN